MIKILIVRRDNIGDLICTLPLISAVRRRLPQARIDVLVNSYNAEVVKNNADIDHVYVYTKAKHKTKSETLLHNYWQRACLTIQLWLTRYDYVILANVGLSPRPLRWARLIRPKNVVGFAEKGKEVPPILNLPIWLDRSKRLHEVQYIAQLMEPFGGCDEIVPPVIMPEPESLQKAQSIIARHQKRILGFNISARLPSQQWSLENWVGLIRVKAEKYQCVLFWSPGSANNPLHPGDDEKAAHVLSELVDLDVIGLSTCNLNELIAGMSLVDALITPDGGAMHIGAACGKPVVALFGDSDSTQWHPWGVPFVVLQTEDRHVNSINIDQVIDACAQLGLD